MALGEIVRKIEGPVVFASLALELYHLTSIPELGEFAVSSWAVPTEWIVDHATMVPSQIVAIEGEGHQAVAFP